VSVSISTQPARIAGMFDQIAARYDLLNLVLSGGLDRRWRRRAVRALALSGRERVLDVCTGTGDLAMAALRARAGARDVVGVDFAGAMLARARDKARRAGLGGRFHLAQGDATRLPLPAASVDAVMVAFGIRNVERPADALAEFRRVLRPGGRLAVLEFGQPRSALVRAVYGWYGRHVLPRIGRAVSRHPDAYEYLPASVAAFPAGGAFVTLLRHAGFEAATAVPLTFGIVYLYVARTEASDAHSQHVPARA